MLVIRLARQGRNKYPVYRIVAAESARAVTGKFVAVLGHYNPHTKELVMQTEEIVKHLGNGAQPSNSVIKLLQRENVELPAWVKLQTKNRKPKHEPEVKEEAPQAEEAEATEEATEVLVEEATETPAEAPVATVAEENAEAIEENATETVTETVASEEARVEAAEAAEENAAEAAAEPTE